MATIRARTGRHGDVTYTAMVRRAGFPTLTETFPNKRDAERWATLQESAIIDGKVSKDAQGRKRTIGEAITRFRAEVVPQLRNGSMYGFTLDWWAANHGAKKLGEVSRGWLSEARTALLTGTYSRATPGSKRTVIQLGGSGQGLKRTPATANRYMAALSAMFTHACGDWEWLQPSANPFTGLSKLKEAKGRTRHLSPEERTRLLTETVKDPQLHTLVQVALATGARAGELIGLTWAFVELRQDEGRLMFVETKNGEARVAWLFGDALATLSAHCRVHGATVALARAHDGLERARAAQKPVFPGQWSHKHQRYGKYDYMPRFRKALKAARIANFRFHDLRHTALTALARQGLNGHQLKAVSGHKSDVINRYVHLASEDTKQALKRLQTETKT